MYAILFEQKQIRKLTTTYLAREFYVAENKFRNLRAIAKFISNNRLSLLGIKLRN
jgi:hypothetical protein